MLKKTERFFGGRRELSVSEDNGTAVFDFMMQLGIGFDRERRENGLIIFELKEKDARNVIAFLKKRQIEFYVGELKGLPHIIGILKCRPMLVLGAVLFFAWMTYASKIIWDVKIIGNTKTDSSEIISLLEELGCGVGDYYPSIDFNRLHEKYSAIQHDIAWLSVYMNGTVAEVQVRELYADEREKHDEGVYANIVAVSDGIVEEINVFEGEAVVERGDIVKAGQVLISGVVEKQFGYNREVTGQRYEYASGEVICRVAEPISEKISLVQEIKQYTGREKTCLSVKFFKKIVNLFRKGGIEYGVYDTIYMLEKICPFNLIEIPVWLESETYREYVLTSKKISPEEAVEAAVVSVNEKIRALTQDSELVSQEMTTRLDGDEVILECLVYLRRDNGCVKEFTVVDNGR